MKKVRVTVLKNKLSHYLRLVKKGETIEVVDRSIPIARLTAIPAEEIDRGPELDRLIKEGIVTPGARPSLELLKHPPVPCKVDAVQVLVEERRRR
jgi:prevent-host-death family protein